jgi:Aldo/keto reductase family
MLNPSAAAALPADYPAQDYGRLFDHTQAAGAGVIGIRVLAGGALSGSAVRHPIASPPPEPIGSATSYDADVVRAHRLTPLVNEGFAATLTEAATRFALSNPAMGTILVGMATVQQFEDTLTAVQKGPLRPTRSTGCLRCSRPSSANHVDRRSAFQARLPRLPAPMRSGLAAGSTVD